MSQLHHRSSDFDPWAGWHIELNTLGPCRRLTFAQFAYNLRFPGQYYQAETGLNQNWNRDYDPLSGGRYIESDPIGLAGGSFSTYAYASGDPIFYIDQFGLCWLYVQSTGELLHVDANGFADYAVNGGYSGYGPGYNNPAMQDVQAQQPGDPAGPIPQGPYSIGPLHYSPNTGPDTMNLTPLPGTNTFNRTLLRIHGERKHGPQHQASTGCIIENLDVRRRIAASNDTCLQVVP
jgi:RHS repeat-associated protein